MSAPPDITLDTLCRASGPARRACLDRVHSLYNHAGYRAGDPVSFVWRYSREDDRAAAAWIAAALAYGRVNVILRALDDLAQRWEDRPHAFLTQCSDAEIRAALRGFVYRWTRGEHVTGMLAAWRALADVPELADRIGTHPGGYRPALATLRREILPGLPEDPGHLFPDPGGPGACKRLAMWLRWMVRRDEIDPGLWSAKLNPARLWVPLDTHMFRIARRLRLTRRNQPDGEAARRITAAFARLNPEDPLKYDFGITRLGMGQTANTL